MNENQQLIVRHIHHYPRRRPRVVYQPQPYPVYRDRPSEGSALGGLIVLGVLAVLFCSAMDSASRR